MSDFQDLEESAQAATPGPWYFELGDYGEAYVMTSEDDRPWRPADARYIALASPDRILALTA